MLVRLLDIAYETLGYRSLRTSACPTYDGSHSRVGFCWISSRHRGATEPKLTSHVGFLLDFAPR